MNGITTLTIPAAVLTDVLAGRMDLMERHGGESDHVGSIVMKQLRNGWRVVGCSYSNGDVAVGLADSVTLKLAAPHDYVYWPRPTKKDAESGG